MIISSIKDLLDAVQHESLRHHNCEIYFRGQKKSFEQVTPSIDRDGLLKSEDLLFKEYVRLNPLEFSNEKSTFEKLVKMQHYSLPTRLLDITKSPLTALFFATEFNQEFENNAGEFIIFAVPYGKVKFYDSDTVSAVANIARRPYNTMDIKDIKGASIEEFNNSEPIQYLLHEIKEEKPYYKDMIQEEHLKSIWCVKPLLQNRRIISQDGAFLLFGMGDNKKTLAGYSDFSPIPLKVENKPGIRAELDRLGINSARIYPDLDTTASYLKQKYKKSEENLCINLRY